MSINYVKLKLLQNNNNINRVTAWSTEWSREESHPYLRYLCVPQLVAQYIYYIIIKSKLFYYISDLKVTSYKARCFVQRKQRIFYCVWELILPNKIKTLDCY